MRRRPHAGLLLARRLRRRPNSRPALGRRLMSAGKWLWVVIDTRGGTPDQVCLSAFYHEDPWLYVHSTKASDRVTALLSRHV